MGGIKEVVVDVVEVEFDDVEEKLKKKRYLMMMIKKSFTFMK